MKSYENVLDARQATYLEEMKTKSTENREYKWVPIERLAKLYKHPI